MKTFISFIAVLFGAACGILFNAFYFLEMYKLGIVPIANNFNLVLPEISYGIFVAGLFLYTMLRNKSKDEKYDLDEGLKKIITLVLTKCIYLVILFIINKIVF